MDELQKRLQSVEQESVKAAAELNNLQQRREELKAKANNLSEAIAAMGHSPSLLAQLSKVESEIEKIDRQAIQPEKSKQFAASMQELREILLNPRVELGTLM